LYIDRKMVVVNRTSCIVMLCTLQFRD